MVAEGMEEEISKQIGHDARFFSFCLDESNVGPEGEFLRLFL